MFGSINLHDCWKCECMYALYRETSALQGSSLYCSAVIFCSFISHLIGQETINISEIFMFMVLQERQYVTELVDCTCSNFWAELSWISVNIYSVLQPVYQTLYFQYLVLRKYFYMSFPAVCHNTCTLDRSWSKMTSLKSCWSVHHLAICLSYQCVTPW